MTMQIKRRHGAGAPQSGDLVDGQLGYHHDAGATGGTRNDLYIGDNTNNVHPLISRERQVEVNGNQSIGGVKTFTTASFHLQGGTPNQLLVSNGDAAGTVHWTAAPSGGLLAVATDGTLGGDGTDGAPLSVLHLATARSIGIQGGTNAATGAITTISSTSASFDGSANVTISAINISLDDGTY